MVVVRIDVGPREPVLFSKISGLKIGYILESFRNLDLQHREVFLPDAKLNIAKCISPPENYISQTLYWRLC